MNLPIGVFDSGIGGLSVLKKLAEKLPNEDYLYFGDTARVPYGEKTKEQLIQFGREILDWFKQNKVKAVLMACNTSSAVTLDIIAKEYDFPVFGLISPASKHAASLNIAKIGVMATSATVKSGAYTKFITNYNSQTKVHEIGCPGLVELVESGKVDSIEAFEKVSSYLKPLLEKDVEKVILGCTHYPFLTDTINKLTNNPDLLIDPAVYLVQEVIETLQSNNLLNNQTNTGNKLFFVSGNPEKFVEVGRNFLPEIKKAKKIEPVNTLIK